ncbi:oxidoreductase, short chain dehydrogenase/reductase family protein (macronuclear) [Tetrahymena thermophila SB210]|uniref:Oxidoreductase, short chain dehydrogenase/reductase family protein n=1 Tax=Tetrahymena thermophila (strain SB210) TaxID=312017 RepID=Q22R64_TETTS|nr:oxidoreductase, short chain dehydrogenase/reductase family protein [Tetrahymena thermophila SB210]EAR88258.2 oxidoreductase, short chain dehydrogenase/reductase family protein [Tetrahymena thermophila SB210]|eukprot:XP_001008503.2 oxidoreductase, short chain dehydrogenase/reductase family protein [Tetrahymena thermophila SB210]
MQPAWQLSLQEKFQVLSTDSLFLATIQYKDTGKDLMQQYLLVQMVIGKGFALELARRGFNLVMLIRNVKKGEALAEEIRKTINKEIDIQIVEVDFQAIQNPGAIEAIVEKVKGLDISILVNNVGYLIGGSFEKQTYSQINNIISMNVGAQALLTRGLISQLLNRKQKSAIINLSSMSSYLIFAGFAMYGGTKSFNDYFSRSLSEEYKGKLDVLSVKPGWVNTPMTDGIPGKFLEITPEQCASNILKQLGRTNLTFGHYKHEMTAFVNYLTIDMINNLQRKNMQSAIK